MTSVARKDRHTAGGTRPHERPAVLVRRVLYLDPVAERQMEELRAFYGPSLFESALLRRAVALLHEHVGSVARGPEPDAASAAERGATLAFTRPRSVETGRA